MWKWLKWVLLGFGILIALSVSLVILKNKKPAEKTTENTYHCTTKAAPDPTTDNITWTLPDCASDLRLHFPYTMDEVFGSKDIGITGYGVHAGEHIEGLNHEWIDVKHGTPVRSWADGTVTNIQISGDVAQGEVQISIDYGHNMLGVHMEARQALVKVGDRVTSGQDIAIGWDAGGDGKTKEPAGTSAEYILMDLNRNDGVADFGQSPSSVSPFDYLNPTDKATLVAAYKQNILDPYLANPASHTLTFPYQPYLTNLLFFHTGKPNKLSGEWYSTKSYPEGNELDCLTFIEADNPYYKGNIILSRDESANSQGIYTFAGTFTVDYTKKQLKITNVNPSLSGQQSDGKTYYGIFSIDESGARPTLKFQYQENTYPTAFDTSALTYVLRDDGTSKQVNQK